MSRLYFVVCTDCIEESDVVGKNSIAYGFHNTDPGDLTRFLFAHENHTLKYVDEHSEEHDAVVQKYGGRVHHPHRVCYYCEHPLLEDNGFWSCPFDLPKEQVQEELRLAEKVMHDLIHTTFVPKHETRPLKDIAYEIDTRIKHLKAHL